jgi:hypothetical protein
VNYAGSVVAREEELEEFLDTLPDIERIFN